MKILFGIYKYSSEENEVKTRKEKQDELRWVRRDYLRIDRLLAGINSFSSCLERDRFKLELLR